MKKIILYISFLFLGLGSTNAQINFEHTFTTKSGFDWFVSNTNGIMYVFTDTLTNQVKIYNTDYSLYKSVSIDRPVGYYVSICLPSEKLFDTDSQIEFLCTYEDSQYNCSVNPCVYTTISKAKVFNEDGSILKDFGTFNKSTDGGEIINNGSEYKLILRWYTQSNGESDYDIYSLPGSLPAGYTTLRSASLDQPAAYPNPATTIINVPYILAGGETATLIIYNEAGRQIDQKIIDSAFNSLRLNVTDYAHGLYIYKYNNMSGRFIVK